MADEEPKDAGDAEAAGAGDDLGDPRWAEKARESAPEGLGGEWYEDVMMVEEADRKGEYMKLLRESFVPTSDNPFFDDGNLQEDLILDPILTLTLLTPHHR